LQDTRDPDSPACLISIFQVKFGSDALLFRERSDDPEICE
jgi:hypothetical protein